MQKCADHKVLLKQASCAPSKTCFCACGRILGSHRMETGVSFKGTMRSHAKPWVETYFKSNVFQLIKQPRIPICMYNIIIILYQQGIGANRDPQMARAQNNKTCISEHFLIEVNISRLHICWYLQEGQPFFVAGQ